LIGEWKSLGTQVMNKLSLSIPEEVDDQRLLIQHWEKYATVLRIMLHQVQKLVDRIIKIRHGVDRQWMSQQEMYKLDQMRRPEHWQKMYKDVLLNVGTLTEDVVRRMPPVRDYLSDICKLLCQARLQHPLLHVRVDHGVYIKYGPLEGDADMAAWNALRLNAPVREGNVRKAKQTFVIAVWPGLVARGDLRRESLDGLPEIKGGEQFAVVALEDEMPV